MIALSTHALTRATQSGVPHDLIAAVMAHSDIETPVGDGRTALRISRKRLGEPDLRAALGGRRDRLRSLALVVSADAQTVITVLHHRDGTTGRRYRHPH